MGHFPRHLPRARRRSAFTVVEIMIVLLIMSIIAVIAIDAIAGFEANQRADRAARESLSAFRYARSLAMTTGRYARVTVNTSTGNISVYQQATTTDSSGNIIATFSNGIPVFAATPVATGLTASGTWSLTMNNSRELVGTALSVSPSTITTFNYGALGNCVMNAGANTTTSLATSTVVTFSYAGRSKTLTIKQVGEPTLQ